MVGMYISDTEPTWQMEDRFRLRKRVFTNALISPEKGFLLPIYAEKSANVLARERHLKWGDKGQRSVRGCPFGFSRNPHRDEKAVPTNPFVDDVAESTDRSESSNSSEKSDSFEN